MDDACINADGDVARVCILSVGVSPGGWVVGGCIVFPYMASSSSVAIGSETVCTMTCAFPGASCGLYGAYSITVHGKRPPYKGRINEENEEAAQPPIGVLGGPSLDKVHMPWLSYLLA